MVQKIICKVDTYTKTRKTSTVAVVVCGRGFVYFSEDNQQIEVLKKQRKP